MSPEKQNLAIIIAGPNGAGKTTFAQRVLPEVAQCSVFLNADLIAKGISPLNPEAEAFRAGEIMLRLMDEHVERGDSFAIETTLGGLTYARRITQWQAKGYRVLLFFLALPSQEAAIERVAFRVKQKGHNIPEDVIRRRFDRGLANFEKIYKPLVNEWWHYNNEGDHPILIAHGDRP